MGVCEEIVLWLIFKEPQFQVPLLYSTTILRESDHYPTDYVNRYDDLYLKNPLPELPVHLGYTQTDDTHPKLGWAVASVRPHHLGCIPNSSEVPARAFFFWHILGILGCFGAHRT